MHVDLKGVEEETGTKRELAELFEFPEAVAAIDELVSKCRLDLRLGKALWDLANVVMDSLGEWERTLWKNIDTGLMEDESKVLNKSLKQMDKRVRDLDAYKGLELVLKNFMTALPCVSDLRSECMRDRHWQQLMEITGVSFEMGSTFSLKDLLSLQLHSFIDDVAEVVDRATKEDKMEQARPPHRTACC